MTTDLNDGGNADDLDKKDCGTTLTSVNPQSFTLNQLSMIKTTIFIHLQSKQEFRNKYKKHRQKYEKMFQKFYNKSILCYISLFFVLFQ